MHLPINSIQAFFGFFFLVLLTFWLSENKKAINWKLIISAFICQNLVFLVIHYVPFFAHALNYLSQILLSLLDSAKEGARFIFGDFVDSNKYGFIFGLVVVPTIVFFGAIIGIFYFFGIIQFIISVLAYCLRKSVELSGVESLIVIADIFLGQTEGPLVIGPYVKSMTKSELALAFTAGLANISGSTLGIYLVFLGQQAPDQIQLFTNYLVTASVMNALSAIVFAKILFPETDFNNVSSEKIKINAHFSTSLVDSIYQGVMTGFKIGATLVAILIAIISLIHAIDHLLALFGNWIHINDLIKKSSNGSFSALSLEYILGQIFRVFAFFMGVSWQETINVGSLLGQKVAINEFIAYISLEKMRAAHLLSQNSILVSTFALASFSNFSSIGISLGVFSVLAPSRQQELSKMAWKCLYGAVLAGFMTATIAGFWSGIFGI
jgi:CNT family concentrative nucleoside transporter